MVRIFQALVEQAYRFMDIGITGLSGEGLFRKLYTTNLVLCRHLAFATFPGMELVGVELSLCLFVTSQLVEQGNLFEHEVVALGNQFRILLQEVETLLMGLVQTLVELVQLHEDATVCLVQMERLFHIFKCLLLTVLLVEACQRQIAPDGGERRIELCGTLPMLYRHIILSLVVVEAAEVVRCLGSVGIHGLSHCQHVDILQTVGETAVAVYLLCLFKGRIGRNGITQSELCPTPIIIGHRVSLCGQLQNVDTLLPKTCLSIVERQFMIVMNVVVHQLLQVFQRLTCQQVLLEHTAIVETVEFQRLVDPRQCFVLTSQQTQDSHLQGTCLMVAAIENKTAVQLVERIVIASLQRADAGCLEIAGIGPCLVPRGFPEELVCLLQTMLELQTECQIEQRLTVIRIGIALLPDLHRLSQIGFCLLESSTTQIPESRLIQTAHIVGITAQGFLIIVER